MIRSSSIVVYKVLPFFAARSSRVLARGVTAKAVQQSSRSLAGNTHGLAKMSADDFHCVQESGQHKFTTIAGRKSVFKEAILSEEELKQLMDKMDGFFPPEKVLSKDVVNYVSRINFARWDRRATALVFLGLGGLSLKSLFSYPSSAINNLAVAISSFVVFKGCVDLVYPKFVLQFDFRNKQFIKFLEEHSSVEELVGKFFSEESLKQGDVALFTSWMYAQPRLFFTVTDSGKLHIGNVSLVGEKLFSHEIPIFNPDESKPTFSSR